MAGRGEQKSDALNCDSVPGQLRQLEIRTDAGPYCAVQVRIQRWPVHQRVAGSAMPGGVFAAAVAEAGGVADEDLVRAARVAVGASRRWVGDPLPARGLN